MRPFGEILNTWPDNVACYARNVDGGAFAVRFKNVRLAVIASTGEGWDHVSVSHQHRIPKYEEMCRIKEMFFCDDEIAIEYHMPPLMHINVHPNCLHLWRPQDHELPVPPEWMV